MQSCVLILLIFYSSATRVLQLDKRPFEHYCISSANTLYFFFLGDFLQGRPFEGKQGKDKK